MMTDKRLHEIGDRLEVVEPGPWLARSDGRGNCVGIVAPGDGNRFIDNRFIVSDDRVDGIPPNEATFIAHAREDIRDLLDEVWRLRRKLRSK